MKHFHLVTWKEFESRSLKDKQELLHVDDIQVGLKKIKDFNAQKRLTTTDYRTVNLSLLLKDNGLNLRTNQCISWLVRLFLRRNIYIYHSIIYTIDI